ncbi:MAG: T9SS type A sorting domain-containing protein [Bacteroidetes bacterium]|nr:T9SS type A sorting domain-containing protein [Bacteroidota bacterium]
MKKQIIKNVQSTKYDVQRNNRTLEHLNNEVRIYTSLFSIRLFKCSLFILFLLPLGEGLSFAQYTKLLDFAGTSNGSNPHSSLISDGTFLYGMTSTGGTNNLGTIFKIKFDGTGFSKLLDFAGASNGAGPYDSFISDGTFLYGMTRAGGTNDIGTIFKIKPDGTGYSKLHDFGSGSDGFTPNGSLLSLGTFLYGMTSQGGTNGIGTIFKIKPDGSGYLKLLDFNNTNGSNPYGSFITDGTILYGMTKGGGTNGLGTIFKIMPDGTGYTDLFDFSGTASGSNPRGSLVSDGTFFYGMTEQGGTGSIGVAFKIKTDGTGYLKLFDCAGLANGRYPAGSLVYDGTYIYGMAHEGGSNNLGLIYKIKTDGTGYYKLLDFAGASNGSYPYGSFISDGTFLYGMTDQGGTNGKGTIFKIGLTSGIAENNAAIDITVYPNPTNGKINVTSSQFENLKMQGIEIYNVMGENVYSEKILNPKSLILNLDMPSGVYFLHLKTERGTATQKLIINK